MYIMLERVCSIHKGINSIPFFSYIHMLNMKERKRDRERVNWKNYLRDCWVRRSTDAATCQFLFLFLRCDNDVARCNERWLRRCENSQIVILLMNIIPSALCFYTTFKASIITIIWCICNAQIIDAFLRSKINSVEAQKRTEAENLLINNLMLKIFNSPEKFAAHIQRGNSAANCQFSSIALAIFFLFFSLVC